MQPNHSIITMSLPSFNGVTQKQDDLLAKGFPFKAFALGLYHKCDPVSFTAKSALQHTAAAPTTKIQFNYKLGNLVLQESLTEATQYQTRADYVPPKHKDVTLSGEMNWGVSGADFSVSVQQVMAQVWYRLTVANSLLTTLAVVAGKPERGFGLNFAVDKALRLKTYNAVGFLRFGKVDLALKHESNPGDSVQLGKVVLSMYHECQKDIFAVKINTAAKAAYDHASKDHPLSAQAGVKIGISKVRTAMIKAQCSGTLTFAYRLNYFERVKATAAVQVHPQRLQDSQFGFKLKLFS